MIKLEVFRSTDPKLVESLYSETDIQHQKLVGEPAWPESTNTYTLIFGVKEYSEEIYCLTYVPKGGRIELSYKEEGEY